MAQTPHSSYVKSCHALRTTQPLHKGSIGIALKYLPPKGQLNNIEIQPGPYLALHTDEMLSSFAMIKECGPEAANSSGSMF